MTVSLTISVALSDISSDISSDILYEKPAAYAKIGLLIGGSENGICVLYLYWYTPQSNERYP
jgi:hypothetical protein